MSSEFSRKKALVFGVLLLVFLAIPVTVYTALQQQSSSTRAAEIPEEDVVAIVNGEQITKADVRKVAEEQYAPNAVDQLALQDALEILIERKLLDNAVNTFGLTLDQNRVERFKLEEFSDTDSKYEALKQQVILSAVNSREASSIGYWNPPSDGIETLKIEEQADAATQLEVGTPVLASIEIKMQEDEALEDIIESALGENPDLLPVLALNGFIYAQLGVYDRVLANYPQVYEFGNSGLDDETRNSLFAQDEGAVISITDTEANRGGYVFRVETKGNVSGANTYEEWLAEQRANLVKEVNPL